MGSCIVLFLQLLCVFLHLLLELSGSATCDVAYKSRRRDVAVWVQVWGAMLIQTSPSSNSFYERSVSSPSRNLRGSGTYFWSDWVSCRFSQAIAASQLWVFGRNTRQPFCKKSWREQILYSAGRWLSSFSMTCTLKVCANLEPCNFKQDCQLAAWNQWCAIDLFMQKGVSMLWTHWSSSF